MKGIEPFFSRIRLLFHASSNTGVLSPDTTGQQGEQLAADYLQKEGFCICERNYVTPYGEIDIIARRKKHLHIIEVKTLKFQDNEDGRINLTRQKLSHFFRSGMYYLKKQHHKGSSSFAAVIITLEPFSLKWYDNLTMDCEADTIIKNTKRGRV